MEENAAAKDKDPPQRSRVCVAVRCRPLNEKESTAGAAEVVSARGDSQLILRHKGDDASYAFDHVFMPEITQEQIFQTLGVPQLDQAFDGYNSTIFAYGQTGSGKTHTMLNMKAQGQDRGLIPRISEGLFQRVAVLTSQHETRRFLVQCSFLEIYNEVIYDLLAPKRKGAGGGLEVKEQKGLGVYVKDLTETVVEDAAKLEQLIEEGMSHRATAATKMNDASSRSHCIFTIKIHQKDTADPSQNTISKMNLVDLAGSERARDTGAEGALLKEGANINKSLSALGNVINALSSMAEAGKRKAFVPYRDSKLTRVLQESLGGNSFCTMVAAVSPAATNSEETFSTLNYAKRAKVIKVVAKRNAEAVQLKQIEREVETLHQKLGHESAQGSREAREAEERHRQELETLQTYMKQSWEDKQKLSEEHEEQRKLAKQEAERVASQLLGERRRRLQMLEQHGDIQLTLQAVTSIGGRLCKDWPAKISGALKSWESLQSQLRAVALYRESAGADLGALWGRCGDAAASGALDDRDVAPALTLLGQVGIKLESLSGELAALVDLDTQVREQLGHIAPQVAVALCDAQADAKEAAAKSEGALAIDSATEELPELLALIQKQLQKHCMRERAQLESAARKLFFHTDLRSLAAWVEQGATKMDGDGQGALLQGLREAAESVPAAVPDEAAEGPAAALQDEVPDVLGLSTFEVPDAQLSASSNSTATRHARLLRTSGFAGWSPEHDSADEFIEVDLGKREVIIVGLSLQGREPCTGHWVQTIELLRLALSPSESEFGFLSVPEKTFARPPVRLVHEIVMALVYSRGCFGEGKHSWEIPDEYLTYSGMSREQKIAFFDELIHRANQVCGKERGGAPGALVDLTSGDILSGKKCEETNRLLQMLTYLCLGLTTSMGGLCDAGPQWVTAWKLEYFTEAQGWRRYDHICAGNPSDGGEDVIFGGSADVHNVKYVGLPRPVMASRLRVRPVKWHRRAGLRCEVHVARSGELAAGKQRVSGKHLKIGVELASTAVQVLKGSLEDRQHSQSKREDDLKEQAAQERGDLERRLEEALERAAANEARAVAAEAALLHARADNERLGAAVKSLESESSGGTELRAVAETRASEREKDCADLQAQVIDLTEQLLVMTDARDALRTHEEDLAETIAAKDEELSRAHRAFVDLTQRLGEKELEEETSNLLANEMGQLSEQLRELQDAHEGSLRECGRLRQETSRLQEANKALTTERDKLVRKKEKLENKKADLVDKLKESEKARQAARERCMGLLERERRRGEVPDGDTLAPLAIERAMGQSARSGGKDSARSARSGLSSSLAPPEMASGQGLSKSPRFGSTPSLAAPGRPQSPAFGGDGSDMSPASSLVTPTGKRSKGLQKDTSMPSLRRSGTKERERRDKRE